MSGKSGSPGPDAPLQAAQHELERPSLPWRMSSSMIMGLTGGLSRAFLYGLNHVEVVGLDRFLSLLDRRKDVDARERGLVTVSNHISVLDDPLMWGVLPMRYAFNPSTLRWGLGAHDICFKNKFLENFFSAGRVLPTHRAMHSPHGGLFQPTMTQAIRLLSSQPFEAPGLTRSPSLEPRRTASDVPDPFTSGSLTFSTNGVDSYTAPSVYSANRFSWVHVFPEACVHQHDLMYMRYFKWGVSRMILEAEPMPDVLPIFIDGTHQIMNEARGWPRFLPRAGKTFRIAFGELVDTEGTFGDLRSRWRQLVHLEAQARTANGLPALPMGELTDELKYGDEAVRIRIECARRVRDEILKVRRGLGHPEEKPGLELAETWARDPSDIQFKSKVDDSLINKTD